MNPTPEELAANDRAELAAVSPTLEEQRAELPKVCLHPLWWMPPILEQPRLVDPAYAAYRQADRRFRRAFGRSGSAGGRRQQLRSAHALAHLVATRREQS